MICHPAIKNDSGAILRFFEITLVLVRLDHVGSFMEPAPEARPPEDSEQKTG
jgi:hypothetical protein